MRIYLVFLMMLGLLPSGCSKAPQQVTTTASALTEQAPQQKTQQMEQQTTTETPAVAEEAEKPAQLLGELKLSAPKEVYKPGEAIPLKLEFVTGKFDLLSATRYLVGDGPFVGLEVTDADGSPAAPRQIINISQATEKLYHDGQLVGAIPGLELAAGSVHSANLKDLGELYKMQPGVYEVKVKLHMPVYHGPKMPKQSPAIAQAEEEIASLQRDQKLSADAKSAAILTLREQIGELRSNIKERDDVYYVNAQSVRGYVDLESNTLQITVE